MQNMHAGCQHSVALLYLELAKANRFIEEIQGEYIAERNSHSYFKSRLAMAKAENASLRQMMGTVTMECIALSTELHSLAYQKDKMCSTECAELEGPGGISHINAINLELQPFMCARFKACETQHATDNDMIQSLQHVDEYLQKLECIICLDRTVEVAMAPCGHACVCSECSVDLENCPMCRSGVSSTLRLYFA